MKEAASIVIEKCMDVKPGEKVLILADKDKLEIGEAFLNKAKEITESLLVEVPVSDFNGQEPSDEIAEMMKDYDVIILVTTKSLSHTDARRNACLSGARIASMPGVTKEMMERALNIDHGEMTELTEKLNSVLFSDKTIRITTDKKTDVTMIMHERMKFTDQGLYHKKGDWGNLPAGEAGGAPIDVNGMIVVDGSFAGVGKLEEPIKLFIEDGKVVQIEGGKEATKLKLLLESFKDDRVYKIAELGIGTNPKAIITGNVLEDEKVLGTAHVAVGNNIAYGGDNDAPCHLDGVFTEPTIFIDDKKIMDKGKLV